MAKSSRNESDLVNMLSIFSRGTLNIRLNGDPFLKVDGDSQSIDVEAQGLEKSGIQISSMLSADQKRGVSGLLTGSRSMAKNLHDEGWRVAVVDKGNFVLKIGRGVSRLTGYISLNPMKLRTVVEILRQQRLSLKQKSN